MGFKTEARQAKAGERIVIVDALPSHSQDYKEGDVFTVYALDEDGDAYVDKGQFEGRYETDEIYFLFESEYEVIIGEEK